MKLARNRRQALGRQLWSLADLTRAGASRREFRSRAYRQAVWALDEVSADLEEPLEELLAVPGIGAGVGRLITEFRDTDGIEELRRLQAKLPEESVRLRLLPRMTPTRLSWLKVEAGIETVQDLIDAIDQEKLSTLKGAGPETARVWRERSQGLLSSGLTPLAAHAWSHRLLSHIERHVAGAEVIVTGAVRRLDEWVDAIDLVAGESAADVMRFLQQSAVVTGFAEAEEVVRCQTHGALVTLHPTGPRTAAAAVFRTTGPVDHVEAVVRSIGDRGDADLAPTETDIYRAAGLAFVPPPARSQDLEVPGELVEVEHLRGDLHLHSDWSPDGRQTIEELVQSARARGLEYVAITDHAKGLRFGGLDEERLELQREAIERIRPRYPDIVILHASELNIDRNGDVDFDAHVLTRLDLAIAAVHSHFSLDKMGQTRRLLNAISNPMVNVIAHLTGRRIGIRPPIELDIELVLSAAAEHGTALEVNGHLDRMDAPAEIVGRAGERGVLFAANSDAHRGGELANIEHSVGILQRGLVTHPRVVNTWPVSELLEWAGVGRRSRSKLSRD
ncbi:MAG TPA: PHP domain-containing protein [Acidimicrobiia bacterium]|nr:PHP domain-containing protein [Acidimicrobiia bacterium]